MIGSFLLDTNIIIALFAQEESVLEHLMNAGAVFVPVVALGELYFEARKSGDSAANVARVNRFAATAALLDCTQGAAEQYGNIKALLRTRGRPLPENDIWIAAIAMHHDLPLVT